TLGDFPINRRQRVKFSDLIQGKVSGMIDFVTVRCGLAANRPQDENNINPVAIVRIVATAKPQDGLHFGRDSRFFLYLTNHSFLDSYIPLNDPSGQPPGAAPVTPRAPYEQ